MTIDEIFALWDKDSDIDVTNIGGEITQRPKLYSKYVRLFTTESLRLKNMQIEHNKLKLVKSEYYLGRLDDDELAARGWEPFRKKILKGDVNDYLGTDEDVIKSTLKLEYQQEKVNILEGFTKDLQRRGYELRTLFEYERFKAGA